MKVVINRAVRYREREMITEREALGEVGYETRVAMGMRRGVLTKRCLFL